MATLAGAAPMLNWLALPAVLVGLAIIFAGAVVLDYRRQRAAQVLDDGE